MLLVHQSGSVRIGEVVRYTVTYTPSSDRILPSPSKLYVRIRNTSAIALRAAFVHGPYTLSVAAYPSTFTPNEKFPDPQQYGVPEYEPMVKAGGSWECELIVPNHIRQTAARGRHAGAENGVEHDQDSVSWVIEVTSQVIFSTSAAVGYEILVARDYKSLNLGMSIPVIASQSQASQPGKLSDHQNDIDGGRDHHSKPKQPRGIFSRAVRVKIEDTAEIWNTPRLPTWEDLERKDGGCLNATATGKAAGTITEETKRKASGECHCRCAYKPKKVHLVVLTHGLHSNLNADMLFLKESIDAAVKQAKIDAKARKAREGVARGRPTHSRAQLRESTGTSSNQVSPKATGCSDSCSAKVMNENVYEEEDEEVIVRGYSGNATKTERGIKYLGKRLARYVLSTTYPDQPYLPMGKDVIHHASHVKKDVDSELKESEPAHKHSTIHTTSREQKHHDKGQRAYKITSISFVAHSLGGLVQTYAIAYIQKHSPEFFNLIKPINFIALATPFLGLSNENPMYVKFALDFGLVGRTGKDLGLTWRAPTIARSGWGAIVGNLGETAHKKVYGESQPESKPLLRILPTGPAHTALKKFRNRTVYSNVVNDGIVPLRTSCLLFLDWHGLGRVEKARRDAGLVETVVGFGWAELTGTKMMGTNRPRKELQDDQPTSGSNSGTTTPKGEISRQVPQPSDDAVEEDDRASIASVPTPYSDRSSGQAVGQNAVVTSPFSGFFNFFKSNEPPKPQVVTQKQKKILNNSQTTRAREKEDESATSATSTDTEPRQVKVTTGNEFEGDVGGMNAPPRTTFFESAGDLLNPHIPDVEYLLDPSKRPRTIFHDRVYHPEDIPPAPIKPVKRTTSYKMALTFPRWGTGLSQSSTATGSSIDIGAGSDPGTGTEANKIKPGGKQEEPMIDGSNMRVEEKIARGYHRNLSWRKVLVKLEPDAHNNILVRRMFANAYGWPVIKHLVDAHFSDSATARMRNEDEHVGERALDMNQPPDEHGGETRADEVPAGDGETRTQSETREAQDSVCELPKSPKRTEVERSDSMTWSERDWLDSECDSDFGSEEKGKSDKGGTGRGGNNNKSEWNWNEMIAGKGKSKSSVVQASQSKS